MLSLVAPHREHAHPSEKFSQNLDHAVLRLRHLRVRNFDSQSIATKRDSSILLGELDFYNLHYVQRYQAWIIQFFAKEDRAEDKFQNDFYAEHST